LRAATDNGRIGEIDARRQTAAKRFDQDIAGTGWTDALIATDGNSRRCCHLQRRGQNNDSLQSSGEIAARIRCSPSASDVALLWTYHRLGHIKERDVGQAAVVCGLRDTAHLWRHSLGTLQNNAGRHKGEVRWSCVDNLDDLDGRRKVSALKHTNEKNKARLEKRFFSGHTDLIHGCPLPEDRKVLRAVTSDPRVCRCM
jgi:hypothetical protein